MPLQILPFQRGTAAETDVLVDIPFKWGRADEVDCEYKVGRMPDAEKGLQAINMWMAQLGLGYKEMVALMGAHSVGNAHINNSGYGVPADTGSLDAKTLGRTSWVRSSNAVLDGTSYYKSMVEIPWVRSANSANTRHAFKEAGKTIMLSTDMALFWNLKTDSSNSNLSTCDSPAFDANDESTFDGSGGCPWKRLLKTVGSATGGLDTVEVIISYTTDDKDGLKNWYKVC
jgi:hypothetical protein